MLEDLDEMHMLRKTSADVTCTQVYEESVWHSKGRYVIETSNIQKSSNSEIRDMGPILNTTIVHKE